MFKGLWCYWFHKKYRTWMGMGDNILLKCTKCDVIWPEPRSPSMSPRATKVTEL